MKNQRMWGIAVAALTMNVAVAAAQQAQQVTFAQAIDLALKQNLSVREAENNLELQQATAKQARQLLVPSLGFSMSGSDQVGQQFNLSTGKLSTQTTQSLSPNLNSSVTVFDFNRTRAGIVSAQENATASASDLTRQRQTAVFTVASDFVQLVSAQGQLDVQRENLKATQAQLDQIQQFANAGARPISDLYQQQAQVAGARLSVVQAEQSVDNAKLNLTQALQLDPTKEYDFVAPVIPDIPTRTFNLDSLVAVAYAKRPDIQASKVRVSAAGQDLRSARASRLPSFRASAGYGSNYTSASDSGIFNQFNQRRSGSVSLSMNIPIYDQGSVKLSEQRASINEENAQLALVNQQQTVAIEVRKAWLTVRSQQSQLAAATAQQLAAQQALDAVQQRYNVGAATLLEITQSRSLLVNAQSSLVTAKYALVLAQAVLAYYTGELDPANIKLGI